MLNCSLNCHNRDFVTNSLPHFMLFLAIIIIVYRGFLFLFTAVFFYCAEHEFCKNKQRIFHLETLQSLLKVWKSEEREGQLVIHTRFFGETGFISILAGCINGPFLAEKQFKNSYVFLTKLRWIMWPKLSNSQLLEHKSRPPSSDCVKVIIEWPLRYILQFLQILEILQILQILQILHPLFLQLECTLASLGSLCSTFIIRSVGVKGAGVALAPQDFGISVNPFDTQAKL